MLYLKGQVISGFLPNTFLIFDTQELKLMNFRSTISRLLLNQWFPTLFYLLISFQKEKKKKRQTPIRITVVSFGVDPFRCHLRRKVSGSI